MKKDFLTIRDFSREEILGTLKLATDMKAHPQNYTSALKGKTLAMIFEKPSLRTRVTFDVGIHQLGGFSISLRGHASRLFRRKPDAKWPMARPV